MHLLRLNVIIAIHPPPIEVSINLTNCCVGLLAKNVKGKNNEEFSFIRPPLHSYGIHIEYSYLDRGAFLELADNENTYSVYPLTNPKALTKIHFAVEHIYDLTKAKYSK